MSGSSEQAMTDGESRRVSRTDRSSTASLDERPTGSGRVPDFFVVGHEKCGTTALDFLLKGHPQIFLPEVKEQRFFVPELRGGRGRRRDLDSGRPHTFERYIEVFRAARPGQLVGEVSPQYLRSH